jgi:hypothetical protein
VLKQRAAATAATIALGTLSVTPASANGLNDNDAAAVATIAGGIIGAAIASLAAGQHEDAYAGPGPYGTYGYRPGYGPGFRRWGYERDEHRGPTFMRGRPLMRGERCASLRRHCVE